MERAAPGRSGNAEGTPREAVAPEQLRDGTPVPRREVLLAYLAVLQSASDRAAKMATRYFALRMLVSTVLLALVFRVAASPEQIELLGASLKLAPWTLLVTGSLVASVLLLLEFPQYERAHLFAYRAVRLYDKELGFDMPLKDWKSGSSPWGVEVLAAAAADPGISRRWTDLGIVIGVTALGFFLTVGAEVLAWWDMLGDSKTTPWSVLFGVLPVITFIVAGLRYWHIAREVRGKQRPHLALGKWRNDP